MSNLYIIGTPIGNLKDISQRAIDTLNSVDIILCEDTRVSQKLLSHFGINKTLISYHQHSTLNQVEKIIKNLEQGKNIALVSDAGTPGISDPGNMLVNEVAQKLKDVKIIAIPGPNAMVSAASISGFAMDRFVFLGFPPVKNKRQKFFKEMLAYEIPVIFYESCHRILKTLGEIEKINQEIQIVICRELTKQFETIHRGKIGEVINALKNDKIKGEFTVVLKTLRN